MMKQRFITVLLVLTVFTLKAQIQTGVFRNTSANTDYNQFIIKGTGAALYVNQVDTTQPILALSSGTATPNQGVVFMVAKGGKVGIGTNAPAALLDVRGLSSFSQPIKAAAGLMVLGSSTSLTNNSPWYGIGPVTSSSFGNNIVQVAGYYGLYFKTDAGEMLLARNGNIGIGTTTPQSKLAVNGTVTAKEVNVTTTGWPDYVFMPGYKLLPLDSLSEQIRQQGHLPNMPSAAEIEKNGLSLGEMNKLQQQKIEEMAIYLIRQNRQIKKQQQEIDELKKQVASLLKDKKP